MAPVGAPLAAPFLGRASPAPTAAWVIDQSSLTGLDVLCNVCFKPTFLAINCQATIVSSLRDDPVHTAYAPLGSVLRCDRSISGPRVFIPRLAGLFLARLFGAKNASPRLTERIPCNEKFTCKDLSAGYIALPSPGTDSLPNRARPGPSVWMPSWTRAFI